MLDTRKLPVFASLGEVLSGVTRHYFQLLVVAWPAVVFILGAAFALGWQYYEAGVFQAYVSNDGGPDMDAILAAQLRLSAPEAQAVSWIAQLVLILASAVAAVRWHRFVLLGEGANGFGNIKLIRREDGAYLWATFKLIVLFAVAIVALVILVTSVATLKLPVEVNLLLGFVVFVVAFWGYLTIFRFMLALPDASLGQGGRVFAMFGASAGNSWRLFALILLVGLSIFAFAFVVAVVLGLAVKAFGIEMAASPAAVAVAAIVYLAAYLYFLMAQITMLSVAYREIIGLPAETVAQEA